MRRTENIYVSIYIYIKNIYMTDKLLIEKGN